jgi:hypothetical protein
MRSTFTAVLVATLALGTLTLSACATEDYATDLTKPNFGRRQLISGETVDARVLTNGLYSARPYALTPYAATCVTTSFGCLQRNQWSSFDP